jgi:hypothetical protein
MAVLILIYWVLSSPIEWLMRAITNVDSNYPSRNLMNGTVVMKSKKKPPFMYA